jgi:hypothetical protein
LGIGGGIVYHWRDSPPRDRRRLLTRLTGVMQRPLLELAAAVVTDCGLKSGRTFIGPPSRSRPLSKSGVITGNCWLESYPLRRYHLRVS